jgi:outer membrane receptor protein involved in Fe transport
MCKGSFRQIKSAVYHKAILLLFISLLSITGLHAQQQVSGRVLDAVTKEALVGVTVSSGKSHSGTLTRPDGTFSMLLSSPDTVELNYVGFINKKIAASPGQSLGDIFLDPSDMAMKEVIVSSNVAIERRTPIAVTTIRAAAIEERIGNKEFPELLRTAPSTYVTKSGGGFGDSRINVRGFDQRNTSVMINGVPVNDMENGWVYWSNWAGLADIASNVQVQRGLGASKLSIAAVGGNINIVTKATEMKQGGLASVTFGNDGYMKYTAGYSTGKGKNGLALSLLGSHSEGNGYVDGTMFSAWNYFLTLGWEINDKHTLTFTATGAPQWHNQRSIGYSYETLFGNPKNSSATVRGDKYNDSWGWYKGKEFSWSKNFYHKPVANLNYYWKINPKTDFSAVIYASLGRGGGTGPIGAINGKSGFSLPKDANGLIRFDDIEKWNSGIPVTGFGTLPANTPEATGPYAGQYVARYNKGLIRRSSMNSHNWFGGIFNLVREITPSIKLNGGLDLRYYKGLHYRRIEDGLGVAAYYETKDKNNPNLYVSVDDDQTAIDYHNDGIVKQTGGYLSAEYNKGKLSLFGAGSISNTNYQRIEHFLYEKATDPRYKSEKKDFFSYVIKGGASYRPNEQHNLFANIGYFTRAPLFNTVWPNFNNTDIGTNLQNEKIFGTELGYGFRSKLISFTVNAYRTEWKDKNFIRNFPDPATGLTNRANITGLVALHQGLEFETTSRPVDKLELQGMLSLGDWKYKNDVTTNVYNDNNDLIGTVKLYTKGIKVGDAAQTTASLGAAYEFIRGLKLRGTWFYADNLYANFTPESRSNAAQAGVQAWKLPSYGLFDAVLSYVWRMKDNRKVTLRLNVDNVFDKIYIAESTTDTKYNPNPGTPGYDANDFVIGDTGSGRKNQLYPGFGRTWTIGAKVNF